MKNQSFYPGPSPWSRFCFKPERGGGVPAWQAQTFSYVNLEESRAGRVSRNMMYCIFYNYIQFIYQTFSSVSAPVQNHHVGGIRETFFMSNLEWKRRLLNSNHKKSLISYGALKAYLRSIFRFEIFYLPAVEILSTTPSQFLFCQQTWLTQQLPTFWLHRSLSRSLHHCIMHCSLKSRT